MVFRCVFVLITFFAHRVFSLGDFTGSFSGYKKWSPPGQSNNHLLCPTSCDTSEEKDECCSCKARPCWEIGDCGITVGALHLEYVDIYGNTIVTADPTDNVTYYRLIHKNGIMTSIPSNICKYADKIITLDLTNNRLTDIKDIECLIYLDKLLLGGNSISELDNNTLSRMENLRVLSLSNNRLDHMDPNAIAIKNGNILTVDISYNDIETVDVTNVFRVGPFCSISYRGTSVSHTTNQLNFGVMEGTVFGPGQIDLKKTQMTGLLNFTSLNIVDYNTIPKYIRGRLWTEETTLFCDCTLFPYFDRLNDAIYNLWGNVDNISMVCTGPDELKDVRLLELFDEHYKEQLVCDIEQNCPRYCRCIDTPNENKVVVNCSSLNMTEMPANMPTGAWNNYKIDLLLDNNYINTIQNRNYLDRLVNINLSNNKILLIENSFPMNIDDELTINIEDQILTNLPRRLQYKNPMNIKFGKHPIICNCDNTWIGEWLRIYSAVKHVSCYVEDDVLDAYSVTSEFLGCEPDADELVELLQVVFVPILCFLFAIILLSFLLYKFKIEIMLLKRKYINKKKDLLDYEYDVFLSFCDKNGDVFSWVNLFARSALEEEGYTVFSPWFNTLGGENREEKISKAANKCRHFVVCLCDMYDSDLECVADFNILWSNFASNISRKMTIINFGSVRKRQVRDRRIRAFLNIRDELNYKVTSETLFQRLKRRIGPPRARYQDRYQADPKEEDNTNIEHNKEIDGYVANNRTIEHEHFQDNDGQKSLCNCKYRKCYLHAENSDMYGIIHKRVNWRAKTVSDTRSDHNTSLGRKQSITTLCNKTRSPLNHLDKESACTKSRNLLDKIINDVAKGSFEDRREQSLNKNGIVKDKTRNETQPIGNKTANQFVESDRDTSVSRNSDDQTLYREHSIGKIRGYSVFSDEGTDPSVYAGSQTSLPNAIEETEPRNRQKSEAMSVFQISV